MRAGAAWPATDLLGEQGLGKAGPLGARGVGTDDDLAVVKNPDDHAPKRPLEGTDAVPGLELRRVPEGVDGGRHGFTVEHAGDKVGRARYDLLSTDRWQLMKQGVGDGAGDRGESVAVEEEERRPAMESLEQVEGLPEGQGGVPELLPVAFTRSSRLSARSMLRAASAARSSIDVGDRLPVPVLEKRGSGLKR